MKRALWGIERTANWHRCIILADNAHTREAIEWCDYNGSNEMYDVRNLGLGVEVKRRFEFQNEQDAVLFTLRWCK